MSTKLANDQNLASISCSRLCKLENSQSKKVSKIGVRMKKKKKKQIKERNVKDKNLFLGFP